MAAKKVTPKKPEPKKVPLKSAFEISRDRMTPEQRHILDEKLSLYKNMTSSELEEEILSVIRVLKQKPTYAECRILPQTFAYLGVLNKLHIFKKLAKMENCDSWVFNMLNKYTGLPMISETLFMRV